MKYILCAAWIADRGPQKGRAQCATFGIFPTMAAAATERARLAAMPAEFIHFAPKECVQWMICQQEGTLDD